MKTFLLNHYGFCPGVEKAIKIACEQVKVAKNNQKNIYFEHQLVHNEAVDELLSKYGNYKIYNDETLKSDDIFLISAHGHNYFLDDKLGNPQIESAFCSLLQNRFIVIKKAVEERKKIYYLGEINHPESISTISYIEKKLSYKVQILKDKDDFFSIARNNFLTPTLLIVQSTYKEQIEFNDKNLQIIGACPFVYKRLELIKTMKDFNTYIVVGSKASSNTKSLYNLIKHLYPDSRYYLINSKEEISIKELKEPILICSGTSALKDTIDDIYNFIKDL